MEEVQQGSQVVGQGLQEMSGTVNEFIAAAPPEERIICYEEIEDYVASRRDPPEEFDLASALAIGLLLQYNWTPLGACIYAKRKQQKKKFLPIDRDPSAAHAADVLGIEEDWAALIISNWEQRGTYPLNCPATDGELATFTMITEDSPRTAELLVEGVLRIAADNRNRRERALGY